MLSAIMRPALTQALRQCARGLPPKSLTSRVALARRSFLVAPSYKSRVAVRGFATATASKTTGRTAAKPATKTKAKAKATTTEVKKTAKAPASKKKAAAKPKKPVVKKKQLTPEKKQAMLKRDLKMASLIYKEPKNLPATKWLIWVGQAVKGRSSPGVHDMAKKMKALSVEYKALPPAELERMGEIAAQNKAINAGNFKTWVETHSVVEIEQANKARLRLKRNFNITAFPLKIPDDRLPKRPASSGFPYFVKARLTAMPGHKVTKELSDEWKALPAAEKKPYQDLAFAEFAKYKQEMEKVRSA